MRVGPSFLTPLLKLAVSGLAAFHQRSVFLTLPGRLPEPPAQALADHNITDVVVVGGTSAVSGDVVDDLTSSSIDVDRIAGSTRYATSLELIDHAMDTSDLAAEPVWIARRTNATATRAGSLRRFAWSVGL